MKKSLWAKASMAAMSVSLTSLVIPTAALAQSDDEIVVVGSFIKRPSQSDLPSPITTIGAEDFEAIGAQSIADVTQTLTINTGAQNNPDAFTQNATTGTGSINLRGLGLQSTLILVNGRRQVLNGLQTNDGISFVDTNSLLPLIAIERQDILKDGAAALYGSDAVAGVVNFVTVTDYDGLKLSGDFLTHLPTGQSQDDFRIEALAGKTFDWGSVTVAASWFDRTPLTTEERRLSVPFGPNQDVSLVGNPGSFIVPSLVPAVVGGTGGAIPGFVIDPTGCDEVGGNSFPGIQAGAIPGVPFAPGFCQFDFGDFFNLVPDERRFNAYANLKIDVTDTIEFSVDGSFADIQSDRGNSPTFPFLQLSLVAPQVAGGPFPFANPDNPFTETALFFGRAIGNGGTVSGSETRSDTYRFSAKLEGSEFLNNGYWSLSYTRAENSSTFTTEDTVVDRFQCALLGLQGLPGVTNPNTNSNGSCETFVGLDGTIPTGQIFNPFSTALTGGLTNSEALFDFIIDDQVLTSNSTLDVIEGIAGTDLFELAGGTAAIAVGGQYRRDGLSRQFDDVSQIDQFGFLIGGQDFDASVDVYAFFGELVLPVTDWIEFQLAGRFENFGDDGGSTVDPKIGVLIRPNDTLSLRGTFSTSFRAPTSFQTLGQSTTLQQLVDPISGGAAFAAVRAEGNDNLEAEESRAFNAGLTWEPIDGLNLNVDYFNFSFEQAITQQNAQALLTAIQTDTRTFDVNGAPLEPCALEFTVLCRAGGPTGTLTQVNVEFVNADSIDTSGLDFGASWTIDAGALGFFRPTFEATYILNYDVVDPTAGFIDGEGSRNFENIGSPTPQLRFNAGLGWSNGPHSLNIFARRIGGFIDDQEDNNGVLIEAQTRFDVQYVIDIAEFMQRDKGASFTIGATNLTNELPPFVATNGGFESRVSDPRGRILRFGLDLEF